MDSYEYVMHGKVFKVSDKKMASNDQMLATLYWCSTLIAFLRAVCSEVFASFGGLLMSLKGDPRNLSKIELDMRIYLLAKKPATA